MPIFGELRRRNIFKVILAYVLFAWITVQALATVMPSRTVQIVTACLILGFPVVTLLSWAYELTPSGLRPTVDVDKTQSITVDTGRRLNNIVIALAAIAVAIAGAKVLLN